MFCHVCANERSSVNWEVSLRYRLVPENRIGVCMHDTVDPAFLYMRHTCIKKLVEKVEKSFP